MRYNQERKPNRKLTQTMYYKLENKSKTCQLFLKAIDKISECNQKAIDLAKSQVEEGYVGTILPLSQIQLAGGIHAIVVKKDFDLPKSLRQYREIEDGNVCLLESRTAAGKELKKQIEELPTVTNEEINKILGVEGGYGYPQYTVKDECVLIVLTEQQDSILVKNDDFYKISYNRYKELKNG
jgi:hypothetical protein